MRKSIVVLAAVGVTLVASEALADEGGSGLSFGLRAGYALPMGKLFLERDMTDYLIGMIPIWIDLGYKLDPNIYLGAFFQYGIAQTKSSACPAPADCSASDMRFGINIHYHIMPQKTFDPWFGGGIGYEILNRKTAAETPLPGTISRKEDEYDKGLEFFNVQVGGDYKVHPKFGVGPFVAFALGQYSSMLDHNTIHEWLIFGVRGVYDL